MDIQSYLVPIGIFFGVFYFLVWRPQAEEKRKLDEMIAALAKGDRIVTSGGIHGRIAEVSDATVILEISERARLTIDKAAIARKEQEKPAAGAAAGT